MKKIIVLVLSIVLTSAVAMAQSREKRGERSGTPTERANQITERMAKEYSLTDAQKEKVLALNLEMMENMAPPAKENVDAEKTTSEKKTRDKSKESERRAEMQQKREAYNAQLKEVFTTEQYEAYTKNESERQKRGPRGGERGPRPEATAE